MNNEIRLYGPIGGYFGITAEELISQIPDDAEEITIRIHSPGGSVGEGLAMYNALRDHKARIISIVDGYAASSASFVMLAGDEVRVHKSSMVFVHNPWTYAEGNADELRKTADDLDKHADAILEIYKDRTGMDETELRTMMDGSVFMLGAEAQDNGFATSIIEDAEANNAIAAMLDFDQMAAQLKGEKMTTVKTRKEVAAERDELAANNTAQAEQVATLEAAIETTTAEHAMAIEASNAKVVELTEQAATSQATIDAVSAENITLKASAETAKADAEKFKMIMANPALADAATVIFDGKLPEDETGDAKPKDDEPVNHAEVYENISEPRERMAYWREHENEIINSTKEK